MSTTVPGEVTPVRTEPARRRSISVRDLAIGLAIVVAYLATARTGFRVAFVAEQVTTVWAPTGLAIASLLIVGLRLWPAIWLAAFIANAGTSAPFWTAGVMATGNTLEAVIAAWVLGGLLHFDYGFRRVGDVLWFVVVAVVGCSIIAATIGTSALCAAGVQPWSRFSALWFDWWLGDALGALVAAPPILTLAAAPRLTAKDLLRFTVFVGAAVVITHLVFGRLLPIGAHPLEYVVFPLMIAAAVVGGPPLTSCVVLACSVVTIWNTVRGAGPFSGFELHHNLVLLQTFTGVLASTALLLGAAIAERKAIELQHRESANALRHREEMLRLAQHAGGVATFEWDFQNQMAYCSAEFFGIFGLPKRDGQMQSSAWGDFVHPEDRERMAAHLARALAGAEPASADYRIIRADGAERWISYTGQLQQTTEGTRMLGTVVDITERKRIETTLKATRDAAESANQVKDQFLATLSHELRTPLNAILGYARMLQTNAIAPEKRQRAMDIIERNAVAQNQLIEDLLDMSRITRGQVRLEPWPVPVAGVLREAVEGLKPAAEAKRLILDLDIDPFAGTVMADPTRLQQVFWNLLTNAVKFTGQGGRVQASLRHVDNHVEIAVADTGIGIAADFLPHVFEPFRQADARLARGHGGLGLGLAIARQLVELHGGTIAARSAGHGSGATFVVRLPAYAGDDASFARSQLVDIVTSSESVSLAGVDVIVVDDEEDALTLFREALESAGATVRTATSAGDAMREVMARPPNLLVTDLALPGMDGFALLQEIRATHRTVAVVAVTAYARLDDRIRSLEAGFQAHVAKPIDPTLFVRTLAAALCSFSEGEASA